MTTTFTQPDPTYPFPTNRFCISSDDKIRTLTGIPPPCPFGSVFKRDTCYRGLNRAVKTLQKQSCPFMDRLAEDILISAPDADLTLSACNFQYNAQNFFLSVMLGILSPALRPIIQVVPPSKTAIDFVFGLVPFGR